MPSIPTLPTLVSITATDPLTTDAGTVHYTVTFSTPVIGVTIDQFSLAATGSISGAGITDVTPVAGSNGASYVVTVNTGSGSGTLDLQLTGTNVHDSSGNHVGPFKSELYMSGPRFSLLNSAAAGDINGDGKQDLVFIRTVSASAYSLDVKINDGTGHFTSTSVTGANSQLPGSIRLADVNGDGKLDVLLGNLITGTLDVRLGNGDGTFAAATKYSAGGTNATITAFADFNSDGKADAMMSTSGGVSLLFGNGDGSFGSPVATDFSTSASFASGDLNGDGKIDLLVQNGSGSAVSVRLGNGDGTFQSPINAGTATSYFSGDFNGDGKLDLALVNGTSLSVLLGNGDGTFGAAQTFQAPAAISGGVAADLNGDGKADIVVEGSNNTLSTFYSRGDGTFGPAVTVPLTASAGALTVGDFNGDGNADVVVEWMDSSSFSGENVLISAPNPTTSGYTINRVTPVLTVGDVDVTRGADGNNYINAAHFHGGATTLAGTGNAGDTITVADATTHAVIGTALVGQDGSWNLGVSGLQDGTTYSYATTATDSQGNDSVGPTFAFTVDIAASIGITNIDFAADSTVSNPKVTVQGTTDTAAQVIVTVGGADGIVSSANGSWQYTSQVAPYSLTTMTARFSDAAGNVATSLTYTLIRGGYTLNSGQISNAVIIDNFFTVGFNATETGAIVLSGATEVVRLASTGATIRNGGSQILEYGTSYGALIQAGGTQIVSFQGTANDTVLYGTQNVGNVANRTTIKAGGAQNVSAGHDVYDTVIEALGTQTTAGNDHNARVFGTQYVTGSSYNATIGVGGVQNDYGMSSAALVQSGGIQHVAQGGRADATTVAAGGYQDVYHQSTVTNTVLDGDQQVLANGAATGTTVHAGGRQYVGSGGTTTGTTIAVGGFQFVDVGANDFNTTNAGFQLLSGTATGTVIADGGIQYDYGTASGVTIRSGGNQEVYGGGSADATTVEAGGFQGVANGTVTNTVLYGDQQVGASGLANGTTLNAGGRQYVGSGGADHRYSDRDRRPPAPGCRRYRQQRDR